LRWGYGNLHHATPGAASCFSQAAWVLHPGSWQRHPTAPASVMIFEIHFP